MNRRVGALALGVLAVAADAHAADELRSRQWGLDAIRAERAWTVSRGRGAVVAVVDTGVDLKHPDLAPGLLPGRDFVDGDNDPQDEHGHGTLVAGIIAARSGRGRVVGVAPEARILPVRALDEDGRGDPGVVADAIRWASSQGIDVLNLSLSVEGDGTLLGTIFRDARVESAIEDAADSGILVVIASGNDAAGGKPETAYDSDDPRVLVVGATTTRSRRAAYSNYGEGLDFVAPGGGSDSQAASSGCTLDNAIISTWWRASTGSDYGASCGTSMATAFASGAGALLAADGMDAETAARRLISSARDLGAKGNDPHFGAGILNAASATGADPRPSSSESSPAGSPSRPPPGPPRSEPPLAGPSSSGSPTPVPHASEPFDEPVLAAPPAGTGGGDGDNGPVGLAATLVVLALAAQLARFRRYKFA